MKLNRVSTCSGFPKSENSLSTVKRCALVNPISEPCYGRLRRPDTFSDSTVGHSAFGYLFKKSFNIHGKYHNALSHHMSTQTYFNLA